MINYTDITIEDFAAPSHTHIQCTINTHTHILKLSQNIYKTIKMKFPDALENFQKTITKSLYRNLMETPTHNARGITMPDNSGK